MFLDMIVTGIPPEVEYGLYAIIALWAFMVMSVFAGIFYQGYLLYKRR